MRVMIVDGVERDRAHTAQIVRAHYGAYNLLLDCWEDALQALNQIEDGMGADIAILDIPLRGMSGIELATRMRGVGWGGHIVFVCASNHFAAESYRVRATDYLLKPASAAGLSAALSRIDHLMREADAAGFLLSRKGFRRRVLYSELMYLEVMQHQLRFHLASGEVERAYGSLNDYSQQLLQKLFMLQPNQSYIINARHIRAFERRKVIMRDWAEISVPRNFTAFQQRCMQVISGSATECAEQALHSG